MWGFKETSQNNTESLKGDHGGLNRQKQLKGESWGPQIRGPLYSVLVGKVKPRSSPSSPGQALSLRVGYSPLLETLLSGHRRSLPSVVGPGHARLKEFVRPRAGCTSTQVGTAVVSELSIRSHPDPASNPMTAGPAGAQPGSPIDLRPRQRAFEIQLPLPGPAPHTPMVSFPNPLHSNGFEIF